MAEHGARTPWSDRRRHPPAPAGRASYYGWPVKAVFTALRPRQDQISLDEVEKIAI
jgi:hypothetical protein